MKGVVRPERWEDPSHVEVGQAWDYVGDDEDMLVIVTEVRDNLPTVLDPNGRRNVSVYVVEDQGEVAPAYEGHIIAYSEKHLRRNFRRVS